jgi:hypothetical protein
MYIFADAPAHRPLEVLVPLSKPAILGDGTWYLALMETALRRPSDSAPLRLHISADCVGSAILNDRTTNLLRIVDVPPRAIGSVEYVNPYPVKVNQPVLNAIRVSLSSPDGEDLSTVEGFRCVLHLSQNDE